MKHHLLDIHKVSFQPLKNKIISNISYSVNPGDFVIILGSNGSGKTSLLKLISRKYNCTEGKIYLAGKLIKNYSDKEFSQKVKILTQNCDESLFTSLSILENYLLVKQYYQRKFIRTRSERSELAHYLAEFNPKLSKHLDRKVSQLSGGEKQTLALALAMLHPPQILLLDEHTSALDPRTAETIMELTQKIIDQYHITCLLTTHNLKEAQIYGNRILSMQNGQIHRVIEPSEKDKLSLQELLTICY